MTNDAAPPGLSTLERLCAEMIALRERNDRQHKLFEAALGETRGELTERFGQFAQDAQRAYQQLRDELSGEKRQSFAYLNALLDLALDLDRVANQRPESAHAEPEWLQWSEGIGVASRKAQAVLAQFGVRRFDAVFGDEYRPRLHERVGSTKMEGLGPMRVARQIEPGYASPLPDMAIRRAKILISE